MDTSGPNPLRYSIGDNNNNNEVCFFRSKLPFSYSNQFLFQEENEGEMTQGDRLNEIKARRMQHHHTSTAPTWASPTANVTSSLT